VNQQVFVLIVVTSISSIAGPLSIPCISLVIFPEIRRVLRCSYNTDKRFAENII